MCVCGRARLRACEREWVSAFMRGVGRGGGAEQVGGVSTGENVCECVYELVCLITVEPECPWHWDVVCVLVCVWEGRGRRKGRSVTTRSRARAPGRP